jgi:3-hydroxymyristoyl/3-hydroxydecanoyl-(acyl carrier protein) dehydratase
MAFLLVDRIIAVQPGRSAQGRFRIGADVAHFSHSLAAEAVGQLAAWSAMAALRFTRRPVAGIAAEVRMLGTPRAGAILDMSVVIESCDDDAVAYGGCGSIDGVPIVELLGCVGPMLPIEDFDDPTAIEALFQRLCNGEGAPGELAPDVARACEVNQLELGERRLHAMLRAAGRADFYADHFPRRPVLPGTLLMETQIRVGAQLAALQIEPSLRASLQPVAVRDLKLRSFIAPGETMELDASVHAASSNEVELALELRSGRRKIGTARALYRAKSS